MIIYPLAHEVKFVELKKCKLTSKLPIDPFRELKIRYVIHLIKEAVANMNRQSYDKLYSHIEVFR